MEIINIEATPGETISSFAQRLIELNLLKEENIMYNFAKLTASLTDKTKNKDIIAIVGVFNKVSLTISKTSTEASILEDYSNQLNLQNEAYIKTKEFKDNEKKTKIEVENLKTDLTLVLDKLVDLDFKDSHLVLKWLTELEPCSSQLKVNICNDIIEKFLLNGYKSDANTNEEFNEDDKDNYAGYIIGQCLSNLGDPRMLSIMHGFVEKWEAKFIS